MLCADIRYSQILVRGFIKHPIIVDWVELFVIIIQTASNWLQLNSLSQILF